MTLIILPKLRGRHKRDRGEAAVSGRGIARRVRRVAGLAVQPDSLAAYDSVVLGARQADVLRAIRALHALGARPSDQDIAEFLDWTTNRVTPRRGELHAVGFILKAGDKRGETGRKVAVWQPTPVQLGLWAGARRDVGTPGN